MGIYLKISKKGFSGKFAAACSLGVKKADSRYESI